MAKLDNKKTIEMRENITKAFDEYVLPLTEKELSNEEWDVIAEHAKENAFDKFCAKVINDWYLTNQFDSKEEALKELLNTTELSEINESIETSNAKKNFGNVKEVEEVKEETKPKKAKKSKLSLKPISSHAEENQSDIIENMVDKKSKSKSKSKEETVKDTVEEVESNEEDLNDFTSFSFVKERKEVEDAVAYMEFNIKGFQFKIPNYTNDETFVEAFFDYMIHDFNIPKILGYYVRRDINKMLEIFISDEGEWMDFQDEFYDALIDEIELDTKQELIDKYNMVKTKAETNTEEEIETSKENDNETESSDKDKESESSEKDKEDSK